MHQSNASLVAQGYRSYAKPKKLILSNPKVPRKLKHLIGDFLDFTIGEFQQRHTATCQNVIYLLPNRLCCHAVHFVSQLFYRLLQASPLSGSPAVTTAEVDTGETARNRSDDRNAAIRTHEPFVFEPKYPFLNNRQDELICSLFTRGSHY